MPATTWVMLALCLVFSGLGRSAAAINENPGRTDPSFVVDVWTTEHGLPQNEITCILQTHDGYLWLGTGTEQRGSGLVRFDGQRFTVFDESNTPGLGSSRVNYLFEDSETNLWVGAANGGVVLISKGVVTNLGLGAGTRESPLLSACEDPAGAVWLYLSNNQLWRYDHGKTNVFATPIDRATDYRGLIAEPGGPLWLGSDWQLSAIDWKAAANALALPVLQTLNLSRKLDLILASRTEGYWRLAGRRIEKWRANRDRPDLDFGFYPWGVGTGGQLARPSAACEDRDGNLIVGTLGSGLYWFSSDGQVTHISTNQGLSNDYVFAVHVDREGDLWVGTDGGGLNRVKRPLFHVLEPSRNLVVQSVAADEQGGVWIAYTASPLTYWKDGEIRELGLPARNVFVDRQQRVWVGSKGAGLLQVQANGLRPVPGFDVLALQNVSALHQDGRGWLWVGTQTGLARWDEHEWKTYTAKDGLSSDMIQAIASDPQGAVWIGTEGGGLNCWRDGQFTVFRKKDNRLPSDNISSLCVDDRGVLWIGTDGGGLARLENGSWTRYSRRDGLVSNSIGYLLVDSEGYLWIGSNAGLMRASKEALSAFAHGTTNFIPCRVYGRSAGLPIRECSSGTQPGPCRSSDGLLWFPTIKGLVSIDPATLRVNTNPPPVRIDAILINGQAQHENALGLAPLGPIKVGPGRQHLEIQYSSLNLSAPDRARFRYRLEGHETDWVDAGATRVAHYTSLPPAQYRFHVVACNEDGIWNETGARLSFTVVPPFWRTWWFLGAITLLIVGAISAIVHYLSTQKLQRQLVQFRQQEALEKERTRIARDIHDQLGASLTQVALLGELVEGDKDAPQEVEAHARQISQTARDTTRVLDEIVWAVNPANDTLDGLMTYLCKYTQEYLSLAGLHYRLDVPGQLPPTPLPPEVRHNIFLACKEAVTNVVRHARATAVWFRLRLEPQAFVLEIEDNGCGLGGLDEKAAQTRNGLKNMRRRMEEIGGEFGFAPGQEGGTLVRFSVPLGAR